MKSYVPVSELAYILFPRLQQLRLFSRLSLPLEVCVMASLGERQDRWLGELAKRP